MIRSSLVSIRQTDIFLSAVALKDILLFLHEISLSLEISVHKSLSLFNFREKNFRMVQVGFDLGASALKCITLTPTVDNEWFDLIAHI